MCLCVYVYLYPYVFMAKPSLVERKKTSTCAVAPQSFRIATPKRGSLCREETACSVRMPRRIGTDTGVCKVSAREYRHQLNLTGFQRVPGLPDAFTESRGISGKPPPLTSPRLRGSSHGLKLSYSRCGLGAGGLGVSWELAGHMQILRPCPSPADSETAF